MNAPEVLAALARHVWTSTIFLLVVLLVIVLLRDRLTAGGRFSLALAGILKFAVPDAVFAAPLRRLLAREPGAMIEIPLEALGGALRIEPPPVTDPLWPRVAIVVWAVVAAVLMIRSALTRHRLVALASRTALPPDAREAEALERARRRIGVRRGIDIARCALPEAPAVLRVFRPLVALPLRGCGDLTDEELESLLTHECAHVARHDNLVARIESLVVALFWFHPLIWIAQRITVIERERACDEAVAGSAGAGETYLTALAKFCHAAIVPRLPGVSCMATARLKERMDHVMKYPQLKTRAASARTVASAGALALVLFTAGSGLVGESALAGATREKERYSVRIEAAAGEKGTLVRATVSDNETGEIISAPSVTLDETLRGTAKTSGAGGLLVTFDFHPGAGGRLHADVTIDRNGTRLQRQSIPVTTSKEEAKEPAARFTGAPITLDLKDADLRDLIGTFGKLTGMEMHVDETVSGRVSVSWQNVPWDQAFDTLLRENGLTYRIEGKAIHVSRK